ncbi:MAG TPA: UbiA family prenyltransferase, partial [Anaerolineae bacterium]
MLKALLKSMRPRQWAKNVVVFTALVFDVKLFSPIYLGRTVAAFVLLCLLVGAVYIVNDLADIDQDRQHPTKRNRPIAAGRLSKVTAAVAATAFVLVALLGGFALNPFFGLLALLYFVLNL